MAKEDKTRGHTNLVMDKIARVLDEPYFEECVEDAHAVERVFFFLHAAKAALVDSGTSHAGADVIKVAELMLDEAAGEMDAFTPEEPEEEEAENADDAPSSEPS